MSLPNGHHSEKALPLTNEEVEACLDEVADLLEAQGGTCSGCGPTVLPPGPCAAWSSKLMRSSRPRGTTHDWAVIYRDDHDGHGQWTVITARFGPLRGRRIIRGREEECAEHYARLEKQKSKASLFPS